jgi:hypothetical protein
VCLLLRPLLKNKFDFIKYMAIIKSNNGGSMKDIFNFIKFSLFMLVVSFYGFFCFGLVFICVDYYKLNPFVLLFSMFSIFYISFLFNKYSSKIIDKVLNYE